MLRRLRVVSKFFDEFAAACRWDRLLRPLRARWAVVAVVVSLFLSWLWLRWRLVGLVGARCGGTKTVVIGTY